jgi:hypothetical protein
MAVWIVASAQSAVRYNQHSKASLLDEDSIDSILSTGKSLMPDGMGAQIDPKAMSDLIGYLKNWRYTSGTLPLSTNTR